MKYARRQTHVANFAFDPALLIAAREAKLASFRNALLEYAHRDHTPIALEKLPKNGWGKAYGRGSGEDFVSKRGSQRNRRAA